MFLPCKNIPILDLENNKWDTISFANQIVFGHFLKDNCYKEPGEYKFDIDTRKIKEVGDKWSIHKLYTTFPENSSD